MQHGAEPPLENLHAFVAFARKRVGDQHLAEDLVQDSLLKALRADRKPAENVDVISWFYRILRRSIIDAYRRQGARQEALEKLRAGFPEQGSSTEQRELCRCFERLLPILPIQYRELLQKVDLQGVPPADAAAELGISPNNLTVRLHRARQRLRAELERTCRVCSRHGCLDCSCD